MSFNSRYSNRAIFKTSNPLYAKDLKKRGLKYFRYFETPRFVQLTVDDLRDIERVGHTWSLGDRYYKLAVQYYGDAELWWIIAWFNGKPTEAHIKIGDTIKIPMPLWKIRSALEV